MRWRRSRAGWYRGVALCQVPSRRRGEVVSACAYASCLRGVARREGRFRWRCGRRARVTRGRNEGRGVDGVDGDVESRVQSVVGGGRDFTGRMRETRPVVPLAALARAAD